MKRILLLLLLPMLLSCSQTKIVPSKDSGSVKIMYNAIGVSLDFVRDYKTTDDAVNMLWIEEVVNKLVETSRIKNETDAHSIRQFWAYMLFDKQIKDPKQVTSNDVDMFVKSLSIPVDDDIEIVPPNQLKAYSNDKSQYAIAAKLWSNGVERHGNLPV
jgi:hypothetical protein